jgi:predicted transcriptional regulator
MGMGIVSDKDFDKELTNVDIKPVSDNKAHIHILDKPGRKPNDVNVPDTLRKTIASTAIEHGREAAIDLASQFGISPSSVSAYTQGARSTSTYNERPDKGTIDFTKNRITNKALHKLRSAINHITPDKLEAAKAIDLSTIAKNMSAVIKNMEPEFVFYSPQFNKMDNYQIIKAKDDF